MRRKGRKVIGLGPVLLRRNAEKMGDCTGGHPFWEVSKLNTDCPTAGVLLGEMSPLGLLEACWDNRSTALDLGQPWPGRRLDHATERWPDPVAKPGRVGRQWPLLALTQAVHQKPPRPLTAALHLSSPADDTCSESTVDPSLPAVWLHNRLVETGVSDWLWGTKGTCTQGCAVCSEGNNCGCLHRQSIRVSSGPCDQWAESLHGPYLLQHPTLGQGPQCRERGKHTLRGKKPAQAQPLGLLLQLLGTRSCHQ